MVTISDAIKYYDKEDYKNAYQSLLCLANKEESEAFYYLGLMSKDGDYVSQDIFEALDWFLKGASHDNAKCQYELGIYYNEREELETDKIVSIEWLTKASNQGHVNAMYELAIIYEDNSSLISSTSLLINSSKLGLGKSSYYLASKEARANDNDLALYWYKKAYEQGELYAAIKIAEIYNNNITLYNQGEAVQWFLKAANSNNKVAMYELAKIYIHLDFKVGLDWFLSAAMENHDEAKYYLGDFYINGDVVDKDIEYGSGFFVDIIESGSMSDTIIAKLELFLQDLYLKGEMLDFRFVEKMELLQLARSGDEEARLKFIRQYFYLTIIYKEELITYLEELSENGNIEAQSNLGEYKTNLNPDDIELLVKSSKQGYFWSDLLLFNYLSNRAKGDEKLTTIFKQISINNEIYQMHIGKIYSSGLEDEIDYIKAYNHLQKAVVINQSINNEDRKNLFELVSAGEYFSGSETRNLAERGDVNAQLLTGCFYEHGFGIGKNHNKALQWYELASTNGSLEAMKRIQIIKSHLISK